MPINFAAALGSGLQSASTTALQANAQKNVEENFKLRRKLEKQEESRRQTIHEMNLEVAPQPPVPSLKELRLQADAVSEAHGNSLPLPDGGSGVRGVERTDYLKAALNDPDTGDALELLKTEKPDKFLDIAMELDKRSQKEVVPREIAGLQAQFDVLTEAKIITDADDLEVFSAQLAAVDNQEAAAMLQQKIDAVEEHYLIGKYTESVKQDLTGKIKATVEASTISGADRDELERKASDLLNKPGLTVAQLRRGYAELEIDADPEKQKVFEDGYQKLLMDQAISMQAQSVPVTFQSGGAETAKIKEKVGGLTPAEQMAVMDGIADIAAQVKLGAIKKPEAKRLAKKLLRSQGLGDSDAYMDALEEAVGNQL